MSIKKIVLGTLAAIIIVPTFLSQFWGSSLIPPGFGVLYGCSSMYRPFVYQYPAQKKDLIPPDDAVMVYPSPALGVREVDQFPEMDQPGNMITIVEINSGRYRMAPDHSLILPTLKKIQLIKLPIKAMITEALKKWGRLEDIELVISFRDSTTPGIAMIGVVNGQLDRSTLFSQVVGVKSVETGTVVIELSKLFPTHIPDELALFYGTQVKIIGHPEITNQGARIQSWKTDPWSMEPQSPALKDRFILRQIWLQKSG